MTHVFVSPHPDDVALSCGGLVASLRELGQAVTIVTVFSGSGTAASLSGYQREALGFGNKAIWPNLEAFNRASILPDVPVDDDPSAAPPWAARTDRLEATQADADAAAKRFWQRSSWYRRASIRSEPLAGGVLMDDVPTQGAVLTEEVLASASAGDLMSRRRLEDERYAYFAEASVVFLDLPDAVFRGYQGDDQLLGELRPDDIDVVDALRREIARLEPQQVYVPLAIGNHVDHQLCRNAGLALLAESRRWVMPGPDYVGRLSFYEDFPYAWWSGYAAIGDLPDGALEALPSDVSLEPEYADISDQAERKITGISLYESQISRLFGGERAMAEAVRAYGVKVAALGGVNGLAERCWTSRRV
jgi:LmbE family N-acetylglucosaminyl deacetylase